MAWSEKARAAAALARKRKRKFRRQNMQAKLSHVKSDLAASKFNASIAKIGKLRGAGGHASAAKRYQKKANAISKKLRRR